MGVIARIGSAMKLSPYHIARSITDRLYALFLISMHNNIVNQGKIRITGHPIIDIRKSCKLYIGNGVTLNSRNKGYHINMYSPVKLFADMPGAEIKIGDYTRIHGSCIHSYKSIEIGKNCLIAANCQIIDSSGHNISFPDTENRINTKGEGKPIVIEDDVWIGTNCVILPGVRIGKGSVIAANSVVKKDIPPMVVAGGNPCVVLKDYLLKLYCGSRP
jgi:acetyltransferase-like isoleucine patch superfamily enzyme